MLSLLRDKWATWRLKAHYEREVQQRLLEQWRDGHRREQQAESEGWQEVGRRDGWQSPAERQSERQQIRQLVKQNPHARNILRLLEAFCVGEGLQLTFVDRMQLDHVQDDRLIELMTRLWTEFLAANRTHFSYREFARRVWRDGECFLRIFPQAEWPPLVRFIDPECIGGETGTPAADGIVTEADDVESPVLYLKLDVEQGVVCEQIPAEWMQHCRYETDSNEKRGRSFFAALIEPLEQYQQWQDTELQARKLQSSIVLWRKVQGGPLQAQSLAETQQAGSSRGRSGGTERIRPGTILTTSAGTEIKYLQPDTNFGDAVPLGRMLLLSIAAGAGIPEFMLTSDAANGNYSSTMVAEGPAVKLFQAEQAFFREQFTALWERICQLALTQGLVTAEQLSQLEPHWSLPQLISRDRARERQADVQLIAAGVLSRSEVQRREHLDPLQIQAEIAAEGDRSNVA